jgi:hypothetical protein
LILSQCCRRLSNAALPVPRWRSLGDLSASFADLKKHS